MERVVVFIDGSNFYHGLKANFGRTRVDFYKFAASLCGDNRKLIRIYYYNVPFKKEIDEEKYKSQQKFFSSLENTPYLELKLGRLEPRGNTFIEKGVDILLAVDMLKYAYDDTYDTAILVSGDGDFAAAINAVKDRGKHVEHAYFKAASSVALRKACDKYTTLSDDFLSSCFI